MGIETSMLETVTDSLLLVETNIQRELSNLFADGGVSLTGFYRIGNIIHNEFEAERRFRQASLHTDSESQQQSQTS